MDATMSLHATVNVVRRLHNSLQVTDEDRETTLRNPRHHNSRQEEDEMMCMVTETGTSISAVIMETGPNGTEINGINQISETT